MDEFRGWYNSERVHQGVRRLTLRCELQNWLHSMENIRPMTPTFTPAE